MHIPTARRAVLSLLALAASAACIPADDTLGLGLAEFTFTASEPAGDAAVPLETIDKYVLRFDRIILGFKTMTMGKVNVPDQCSYRGRGAVADVVFNPRFGVVQTFNGIQPADCPDVGIIFGQPGPATTLGAGARSADLVELASAPAAHALVEATATPALPARFGKAATRTIKIQLRFESAITSARFGGCRASLDDRFVDGTGVVVRGVRIRAGERDRVSVRFAAENLFRESLTTVGALSVTPFVEADESGDNDGIVTMREIDRLPLPFAGEGDQYRLADGTRRGSLGDYVRALFRFTVAFRTDAGFCVGNEPGVE